MFVKICGVTRPEDARAARAAGVDAIGINFWPGSKRYVASLDDARAIVRAAGDLLTMGVFVNAAAEKIEAALEIVKMVQLHGDETPAFAQPFVGRAVRAVRLRD